MNILDITTLVSGKSWPFLLQCVAFASYVWASRAQSRRSEK